MNAVVKKFNWKVWTAIRNNFMKFESQQTSLYAASPDCSLQNGVFYKLMVCDNPASSKFINATFPTAFAHFCLWAAFWSFSQYFNISHYRCICYGDLWSVTLDVTIVIVWGTMNCAHTLNLIGRCFKCSDCSIKQLFLVFLLLLRLPYSLRYNNTEIRTINNSTMASKYSSDRKSHISLISIKS